MKRFTSRAWLVLYELPLGGYSRSYRLAGIENSPKRAELMVESVRKQLDEKRHGMPPCVVTVKEVSLNEDEELFRFNY